MKKKILLFFVVTILLCAIACTFNSCGKDEIINPTTPLSVEYLRVTEINSKSVVLNFNAPYTNCDFDVRYSNEEITEENFDSAEEARFKVKGDGVGKVLTVKKMTVSLDEKQYVAIKPYVETKDGVVYGEMQTIRLGGSELLPISYNKIVNAITVHHGESLRGFSQLFDEQDTEFAPGMLLRPTSELPKLYSDTDDADENDGYPRRLSPIIDLEYTTFIDKVSIYINIVPEEGKDIIIRVAKKATDFRAPDSEWDKVVVFKAADMEAKTWYEADIDLDVEYVQVSFIDGDAPVEIMLFGYQSGESDHPPATVAHKLPTVGELVGMCGFVAGGGGNTTIEQMACANVMREYHNMGWTYNKQYYPKTATAFMSDLGNFDSLYYSYTEAGLNVIPCIQWAEGDQIATVFGLDENGKVTSRPATESEKFYPSSYQKYADNMFGFAGRYGRTNTPELVKILEKHVILTTTDGTGRGHLTWLEFVNEPNGEDSRGLTPYQLAALTSAAYDGHCNTLVDPFGESDHFGAKNADPTIKVAMAGLAGIGSRYCASMVYWMKANRIDHQVSMDAFNVHSYFCREFKINGQTVMMGVSPEEFGLVDELSQLVELRDKYYPEKEVWLTEFSWDTATSYTTKTACHAYGEYTARQVQAMWLTRAYLLLSASGVDKATMYMCEDGTAEDTTNNVQYGTCGVIDYQGNKKDSYFYMYTLKETLADYTFVQEIDSGRSNVMIYQYADAEGNYAYALWCPTSDSTKVNDFKLYIDADKATLVENAYGEIYGVKTDLTANDKIVTVNVSENPIYVVVEK